MHVFIGTPNTRGLVSSAYSLTISSVAAQLAKNGIEFEQAIQEGHDVATQRDAIAHHFLKSGATHLFMVDSDMGFHPELPLRLLRCGKPLVGVPCPFRQFNWNGIEKFVQNGNALRDAHNLAHKFNVGCFDNKIRVEAGLLRVKYIGAAVMLIARECLEKIAAGCSLDKYSNRPGSPQLLGYFQRTRDSGEWLTEDFAFCKRWRDVGGEVFAFVDADIEHHGMTRFTGNYLQSLKKSQRN